MIEFDIVVIGGGETGMIAAISAKKILKYSKIIILDREDSLGGLLNSNLTTGFGKEYLGREITAPEYAEYLINEVKNYNIDYKLDTFVMEISKDKTVLAVNGEEGIFNIRAKAIIFATGYIEVLRGLTNIPNTKYAGIHTLENVKGLIHKHGYLPGKEVIIYGARKNSLILARRLAVEGAKVKMVVDNKSYQTVPNSLKESCLDEFNIPLILGHAIESVNGTDRVSEAIICSVDNEMRMKKDTRRSVSCDTVILSPMGKPETRLIKTIDIKMDSSVKGPVINESYQTSEEGIFACGNVLYVHDIFENYSYEAIKAGESAAGFIKGERYGCDKLKVIPGNKVDFVSPQYIDFDRVFDSIKLDYRVDKNIINETITVKINDVIVYSKNISMVPEIQGSMMIKKEVIDQYVKENNSGILEVSVGGKAKNKASGEKINVEDLKYYL